MVANIYKQALENLDLGICLFDNNRQLIFMNPTAHSILDSESQTVKPKISFIRFVELFKLPQELIQSFDSTSFSKEWLNAAGTSIDLQCTKLPDKGIQLVLKNTSETHALLEQIQTMKMWVERYSLAFDGAKDGLWDWNIENDEVYVSSRMGEILGHTLPSSTLSSRQLFSYFHEDDRVPLSNAILNLCKGNTKYLDFEYRVITEQGDVRWLQDRGVAKFRSNGNAYRIAGSVSDITDRKIAEANIKASETRFHALYKESPLSIQIFSPTGKAVDVNRAWEQLWHSSKAQLLASSYNILTDPELESHGVLENVQRGFQGETVKIPPVEYLMPSEKPGDNKQKRWLESHIYPIPDSNGTVSEVILIQEDITRQVVADQVIRHQANHDGLTGLPNRALFFDRLSQAIRKARRKSTRVALLFIDLDFFKKINDSFGHAVGDDALKEAAARMQQGVRESDTVARLAGDEFTIILPEIKNASDVSPVLTKLVSLLSKPIQHNSRQLDISASIGVSIYPEDADSADELLRCADAAMYEAKHDKGTSYHFFTRQMDETAHLRMKLEEDLSLAIFNNQLSLDFQPIIDIQNGIIRGAEALIRWRHPSKGLIPPDQFIPIAEDSDLILSIGQWVIDKACQHYRKWQDLELLCTDFRLSINLSTKQLTPQLVTILKRALTLHGLKSENLVLEITESVIADEIEQAKSTLAILFAEGFRIALDDFGTGYSSLSYLHHLAVSTLKIDKSFVQDIEKNLDAKVLIKAITAMAHNLGLSVVAEGIETQTELEFLTSIRCNYGQGYLLSHPLPAADFINYLLANSLKGDVKKERT